MRYLSFMQSLIFDTKKVIPLAVVHGDEILGILFGEIVLVEILPPMSVTINSTLTC